VKDSQLIWEAYIAEDIDDPGYIPPAGTGQMMPPGIIQYDTKSWYKDQKYNDFNNLAIKTYSKDLNIEYWTGFQSHILDSYLKTLSLGNKQPSAAWDQYITGDSDKPNLINMLGKDKSGAPKYAAWGFMWPVLIMIIETDNTIGPPPVDSTHEVQQAWILKVTEFTQRYPTPKDWRTTHMTSNLDQEPGGSDL